MQKHTHLSAGVIWNIETQKIRSYLSWPKLLEPPVQPGPPSSTFSLFFEKSGEISLNISWSFEALQLDMQHYCTQLQEWDENYHVFIFDENDGKCLLIEIFWNHNSMKWDWDDKIIKMRMRMTKSEKWKWEWQNHKNDNDNDKIIKMRMTMTKS